MKQILISIVASLALYGFVAVAEEIPQTPTPPSSGLVKLPAMVDCGPVELLEKMVIEEYQETALAIYQGLIQLPTGQSLTLPHMIYVNKDTRTTSIIAYFLDGSGMACMMTLGSAFTPAYSEPKTAL